MLDDKGQEIITHRAPTVKPTWKAKPRSGMPGEVKLAIKMLEERMAIKAEEDKAESYTRQKIKRAPLPKIPRSQRPKAIMDLMADGRERTAEDMANRIGGTAEDMAGALKELRKKGRMERTEVKGVVAWKIAE